MKTFIIRSVSFFLFAGLISIGLFFLVSAYKNPTALVDDVKDIAASTTKSAVEVVKGKVQSTQLVIPEDGIPLSSLKLSDEQKSILSKVGVDTQTFVLTKDMLTCANEKLGKERVVAITKGSSLSVLEVTRLLPCLGA